MERSSIRQPMAELAVGVGAGLLFSMMFGKFFWNRGSRQETRKLQTPRLSSVPSPRPNPPPPPIVKPPVPPSPPKPNPVHIPEPDLIPPYTAPVIDPTPIPEAKEVIVFPTAFVEEVNDYRIDPGLFVKYVDGLLRDHYKIGTMIHDQAGGRINHAIRQQFNFDVSVKSIRALPGQNVPQEVRLLKEIDHPCAYKIRAVFQDKRFQHVVRSAIKGVVLSDFVQCLEGVHSMFQSDLTPSASRLGILENIKKP